jgi:hypothetical protein
LTVLLTSAACQVGPALPSPRPLGGLLLTCAPEDALVYIDDTYQGTAAAASKRPLALPAGTYRVEVRRDGYFSHFAEVVISKGVQQRLEVKLRKEPF